MSKLIISDKSSDCFSIAKHELFDKIGSEVAYSGSVEKIMNTPDTFSTISENSIPFDFDKINHCVDSILNKETKIDSNINKMGDLNCYVESKKIADNLGAFSIKNSLDDIRLIKLENRSVLFKIDDEKTISFKPNIFTKDDKGNYIKLISDSNINKGPVDDLKIENGLLTITLKEGIENNQGNSFFIERYVSEDKFSKMIKNISSDHVMSNIKNIKLEIGDVNILIKEGNENNFDIFIEESDYVRMNKNNNVASCQLTKAQIGSLAIALNSHDENKYTELSILPDLKTLKTRTHFDKEKINESNEEVRRILDSDEKSKMVFKTNLITKISNQISSSLKVKSELKDKLFIEFNGVSLNHLLSKSENTINPYNIVDDVIKVLDGMNTLKKEDKIIFKNNVISLIHLMILKYKNN